MKYFFINIFLFCSLFCPFNSSYGQINPQKRAADTTQAKIPRSVGKDTSEAIFSYEFDNEIYVKEYFIVDSSLEMFHLKNPFLQKHFSYSSTGNLGGALINNVFRNRDYVEDFYFLSPYHYQLKTFSNQRYYETKVPFSDFQYSFIPGGGKHDEQVVGILHTQNLNPKLNVGLDFDFIIDNGQYVREATRNTAASIFSGYNGKIYDIHSSVNLNRLSIQKNGGISSFSNTDPANTLPVNLKAANMQSRYFNAGITQEFNLNAYVRDRQRDTVINVRKSLLDLKITHQGKIDLFKRLYDDDLGNIDFYPAINFDSTQTKDSASLRSIVNHLGAEIRFLTQDSTEIKGFFRYGTELQYYGAGVDTLLGNYVVTADDNYFNQSLIYGFYGTIRGFYSSFYGENYFSGYKSGDTYYAGRLGKAIQLFGKHFDMNIKASLRLKEPDYFIKNYISNHYNFNTVGNINEKERTLDYGIKLTSTDYFLSLSAYQTVVGKYVFFDSIGFPDQTNDPLVVQTLALNKRFNLGIFKWNNRFVYQISNRDDLIAIPGLNYWTSFYLDHEFRFRWTGGSLGINLGFDVFYTSKYKAFKYMPAAEQFHLQNVNEEANYGNYPFVNVFLRATIKKARVFVMYENANSNLAIFEPDYFTLVNYPWKQRTIKLGISWIFYD